MYIKDKFPKNEAQDTFLQRHGQYAGMLFNLDEEKKAARKYSWLSMGLNIVCVLAMVYVSMTANVKTYVVRVDNATGRVEVGSELRATNYEPKIAEINYFLLDFIHKSRTVSIDPIQFRQNWNKVQYFLVPAAAQKLNAFAANDGLVEKIGKETTQVNIRSIQQSPGANNTFTVRWSEDIYNISGQKINKRNYYNAIFTVLIKPPTKEEEIMVNPLGIKIADLSIIKEAEDNV